jgi:hypothetical protein
VDDTDHDAGGMDGNVIWQRGEWDEIREMIYTAADIETRNPQ